MRIQYILHADFERPGILEFWGKMHDFNQAVCRPFDGDDLPSSSEYDLLILMGGPQSPLHIDEAPYLIDEIDLIKKTMNCKKPVLGFCLGAQLIGEACGAVTERSPYKEVGVFPVELTNDGMQDPLLFGLPHKFSVVHWHNDMPGLTADASILASSKGCPRQIVRYSHLAYGFQCHPEPTMQNIKEMIKHCPNDLVSGHYVQSASEFLNHDFETINAIMLKIMDNLLSHCESLIKNVGREFHC